MKALLTFSTAASIHPFIIPPSITVKTAASPYFTLVVMLVVTAILLGIMLIYNGHQYLIFRGKVSGLGYGAYED